MVARVSFAAFERRVAGADGARGVYDAPHSSGPAGGQQHGTTRDQRQKDIYKG
jgi:hypothetical protein